MKHLLLFLAFLPFVTFSQSKFTEPTFNNLIDKVYLSNLYNDRTSSPDWEVTGIGIGSTSSHYYFEGQTELLSKEFDGSIYERICVVFNARSYYGCSDNNYCTVAVEYADGESIENKFVLSETVSVYTSFNLIFYNIKPEKFRIRIKSQNMQDNSFLLVKDFSVKSVSRASALSFESSNTGFSLASCENYDECVLELYRQEYIESGIDTLYFNDFGSNDLKNITVNTGYSVSAGSLYVIAKSEDICLKLPFLPNRDINKINLECLFGIYSSKNHNVNIYYNDEFIVEKRMSGVNGDRFDFSYDLDVGKSSVDTLIFIVKAYEGNSANLVLNNILLSQECEYRYALVTDCPVQQQFPLNIEGLDCTSTYRVRYQLIDNENEKGEKVITSIGEGLIKTTGEFKQLPPGSDYTLESDFEGTVMISNQANLYGNHKILGELCFVHEFIPGKWASVALPFMPQRIGAFKDGEGYYLRENMDFYLRSYTEPESNGEYQFTDKSGFNPFEGYIIKVPEDAYFDNNAIFIYSPKKQEVNKPHDFVFDKLYCHVSNPYTHSLSYKDNYEEIENLYQGNVIYKFDGNYFKVLSTDDVILPFESVIVFTGGMNYAPKMIHLENEHSVIPDDVEDDTFIVSVFERGVEIYGYCGPVEIYGIDGKLLFYGYVSNGKRIDLADKGVYLIRCGNNVNKIAL